MKSDALSFFPGCVRKRNKEIEAMKVLKHILVTFAIVMGLTFSVAAQKDDKNRPPKTPPVVDPKPKDNPPRGNPPKGDDKPKKPAFYFAAVTQREDDLA